MKIIAKTGLVERTDSVNIKALSIKQPWLWMIGMGYKTIETRLWSTSYTGDLLLNASKNLCNPFSGRIVDRSAMIVRIAGCRPMVTNDQDAARCVIYDGAYSFFFKDIRHINPFPVKGELGFYNVQMRLIYNLKLFSDGVDVVFAQGKEHAFAICVDYFNEYNIRRKTQRDRWHKYDTELFSCLEVL